MQYISQLNFCAPLLPVNLTVNVHRFYNSVGIGIGGNFGIGAVLQIIEQNLTISPSSLVNCKRHLNILSTSYFRTLDKLFAINIHLLTSIFSSEFGV